MLNRITKSIFWSLVYYLAFSISLSTSSIFCFNSTRSCSFISLQYSKWTIISFSYFLLILSYTWGLFIRADVHECTPKFLSLHYKLWQELTNRQMLSLLNRPLFSHTIRYWYSLILIKIISYTWFRSDVLFPLHHQSHFLHSWNSLCWSSLVLFLYV